MTEKNGYAHTTGRVCRRVEPSGSTYATGSYTYATGSFAYATDDKNRTDPYEPPNEEAPAATAENQSEK